LVWNVRDFVQEKVLRGHTGLVSALAWSPEGHRLVSSGWDGQVIVWDVSSGKESARWTVGGYPTAMTFLRNGEELALAVGTECRILDSATGRVKRTLTGHRAPITAATVSRDGQWLVTASEDGTLRIWPSTGEKSVLVLPQTSAPTGSSWRSAAWSPKGNFLAAASSDGRLVVWRWNGTQAQMLGSWQPHAGPIAGLAWYGLDTVGDSPPLIIISFDQNGQAKLTRLPRPTPP
jgi:WD40 repeat protein